MKNIHDMTLKELAEECHEPAEYFRWLARQHFKRHWHRGFMEDVYELEDLRWMVSIRRIIKGQT